MKRIVDTPQIPDMGSGYGHIDIPENTTLKEVLDWIYKNEKSWGTITIYYMNNEIIRCFDYDLFNKNIFYHHLAGWQYSRTIQKVKFDYCFMYENIDIYIN